MQTHAGITVAALSDIGCQRQNNEDFYAYWEPDTADDFARRGRLAVVADGMGGYEGGEEASRLAVKTVCEIYRELPANDLRTVLLQAFATAHERIRAYAEQHPRLLGMGTTCTAAALRDSELYFAHVGDSRLYLLRGGQITRLTRDHSYVGRLVENGIVASTEADNHPQRHILTAALGAGRDVIADCPEQPLALEEGDVLVLCTDGLWSLLRDDELQSKVAGRIPEEACRDLVALARQRGGPDNITVQVLRVGEGGGR